MKPKLIQDVQSSELHFFL